MGRFGKRDDLILHEEEPFNAETNLESLVGSLTATDAFYVRSHVRCLRSIRARGGYWWTGWSHAS
jgi:hypothetical protein